MKKYSLTKTKMKRHGQRYTRIYRIWCGMKNRCSCHTSKDYPKYGGRGISFSSSWSDFKNFYKDMSGTYKDNLTLERINNKKGYSKSNCKWATIKEQANNREHGYKKRIRNDDGTFKGTEVSVTIGDKTYKAVIKE